MNNIHIFNNTQFGKVRNAEIDKKSMFVASDVARVLGYANPAKAVKNFAAEFSAAKISLYHHRLINQEIYDYERNGFSRSERPSAHQQFAGS